MIRALTPADMAQVTVVRTSVRENHMSIEQMAERGITRDGIIADMAAGHYAGWVSEEGGEIVAFSMADRRDGSIFALFVAPGHERRGHGNALLGAAAGWLRSHGFTEAWLSTGKGTTAARFYAARGWKLCGDDPHDEEGEIYRKDLTVAVWA